jgi:ABC-type enterochelin transport system ATPase subunit
MKKLSEKGARKVVKEVLISFINEDSRLSNVTRIVGKKNAGDKERLIQCLAQRALALEYTQWELQVHQLKKTRVQELAERLSKTNSQSGHITQYMRECCSFKSKDNVVRSIHYSIKQLLQEKLLSDKLSKGAECEGIELGITFAYPDFFTMTFDQ